MIEVDARVSDLLDHLVLGPRRREDIIQTVYAVRTALPGVRVRRTAEGASIEAKDAAQLFSIQLPLLVHWTPEARLFVENRHWVTKNHRDTRNTIDAIQRGGKSAAATHLSGIEGLDVLDDHQWVNVAAMTVPGGYGLCLFDEQGAGKTVTTLFAFDVLVSRDEVDFAIIVAPKSMIAEWPKDFARFKPGVHCVEVATGARRQKLESLRRDPDVLVTNYETVVSMQDQLIALVRRHGRRALLIVDESFFVKSLDALRTRAIRRLREWCGRAFVLCGTPAPNSPHDLVQQTSVVDFGFTFFGVTVPDEREAASGIIQQAIDDRGVFIRHLKRDVLPGLPAKTFSRVVVPMQPDQSRLYEQALRELALELERMDGSTFQRQLASFLARRNALLQICSNPSGLTKGYAETPAKLLALDEIMNEFVSRRNEKVVVWSFYTASLEAIARRYKGLGLVRYDGSVTDVQDRREAIRLFQETEGTRVFVGNPAAAGAGITLHRARVAIYESMSNQAAHYLQSLDRIHRRGQTQEVQYLILLCDRSIEILEYDRLIRKELSAQSLLGDQTDQVTTREGMLAETLEALRQVEGKQHVAG